MGRPLSPEVKGRILTFGAQKWSRSMIVKELKKSGVTVSDCTVSKVLRSHVDGASNQPTSSAAAKKQRRPCILTPRIVKKVKNMISSDNPPSQRAMAYRIGVCPASINCLIHGRLDSHKRKKVKVHHLTDRDILQRKDRALNFFNLIANERYKDILTMDESWLRNDFQNGKTDFYYESNNKEKRRAEPLQNSQPPSHPQQRMFAAGYGWMGQTRLYVVDERAKVNAEYFIERILSPMMLEDVPRLYGADAGRVVLHFDSARSHTAGIVTKWLEDHNMNFITKEEWLANSPEVSPMDFFANGYFKSELWKRKFRTMKGMLKAADDVWSNIPLEMFRNSFKTWPDRVMAIHKAKGHQAPKN